MGRVAPLAALALFAVAAPLASLLAAPPPREVALDTLLVSLDLERRGRTQDLEDLERITNRVASAESAASSARARLVQVLKDGESDPLTIESAEDAIAEAEARATAAQARRRAVAARLAERVRRITNLNEEVTRRRAGARTALDPLTGRWSVVINPGGRRGIFRLVLDGALVSGDFLLDGGFRGSLRGTLVGERISLQRIDSERGLDASFVGRLNAGQKRIVGTWDATQLAPLTGPPAGEWAATQLPEREDE